LKFNGQTTLRSELTSKLIKIFSFGDKCNMQIVEAVIDTLIQIFMVYVAYRFFIIYRATKDKVAAVIFTAFTIFAVVHLPYLVWHHYLKLPFAYSELLHETLFLLVAGLLAWAVWPRAGYKARLKEEEPKETKKKGQAA